MSFFMDLARRLYGFKNGRIDKCDLVVPLGYGLTIEGDLPTVEREVLINAVGFAQAYKAPVAFASSNYLFPGSGEVEDQLKIDFLSKRGLASEILVAKGITNSVIEAQMIRERLKLHQRSVRDIVVVLDWAHARSARIIWEETFREARIHFASVEGGWDRFNPAFLQKSNLRWLVACILRHAALTIFDLDKVGRIQHPLQK